MLFFTTVVNISKISYFRQIFRCTFRRSGTLVLLVLFLVCSQTLLADEFSWSGTAGGLFWDAANWTNNTPEATATVPRFNETDTNIDTVTVNADGQTIYDRKGDAPRKIKMPPKWRRSHDSFIL